jgi:pimeloyl-ACP methyl ester carboxylesterase
MSMPPSSAAEAAGDAAAREPDRSGHVLGLSKAGFHDIAYVEWGPADSGHVVVCVHGLTRQGRDFDLLAGRLAALGCRVICPDLVGRGRSGRLRDPQDYALPQYCSDMNALIARSGAARVDWVGTSLGGLIGMTLAGFPGNPIRRLVVNDIGPVVPIPGLQRIGQYVAEMPAAFGTIEDAERYLRKVLAPFGTLEDEHWRHLTRHSVHLDPQQGRYVTLCDPAITHAFRTPSNPGAHLWAFWDAIAVPILVVRGRDSDLLPTYITQEMARRNPRMSLYDVPGCGHAPTLMAPEQIETVTAFLTEAA